MKTILKKFVAAGLIAVILVLLVAPTSNGRIEGCEQIDNETYKCVFELSEPMFNASNQTLVLNVGEPECQFFPSQPEKCEPSKERIVRGNYFIPLKPGHQNVYLIDLSGKTCDILVHENQVFAQCVNNPFVLVYDECEEAWREYAAYPPRQKKPNEIWDSDWADWGEAGTQYPYVRVLGNVSQINCAFSLHGDNLEVFECEDEDK